MPEEEGVRVRGEQEPVQQEQRRVATSLTTSCCLPGVQFSFGGSATPFLRGCDLDLPVCCEACHGLLSCR
jgi:hypothetical protein